MTSVKALALLLCAGLISSGAALAAIEGGNPKNGKQLILEKCKPCHVQGAGGGTITPLSKTQRQWDRFYKKQRHENIAPGTWKEIADNELLDMMQFMYDHAADSEQPSTCGQ